MRSRSGRNYCTKHPSPGAYPDFLLCAAANVQVRGTPPTIGNPGTGT
jgi:hypothetical protein